MGCYGMVGHARAVFSTLPAAPFSRLAAQRCWLLSHPGFHFYFLAVLQLLHPSTCVLLQPHLFHRSRITP